MSRSGTPFVSVVMPVCDEGDFIARSLGAVLAQDYPAARTEVIVADGGSTDNTRAIVQSLQIDHPNLHLIDNPGRIVPTGLNLAIDFSIGDIIVRVDGHCLIAPDYVSKCVEELQRTHADNVGGKMTANSQSTFGESVAIATSSPFGVGGARFHYSDREEWVDTVYLGAWPREVFDRIGYFDPEMVRDQDDEFNYRLLKHDGRILLSPKIRSVYSPRNKPRLLWRQYFQYGFWKVRVMQKHPTQMRLRQFAPPAFVTLLLTLGTLAIPFPPARLPLAALLTAYATGDLATSIWADRKYCWRHMLMLPEVFAILHLSYGLGFLAGLVRFWNRWVERKPGVQAGPRTITNVASNLAGTSSPSAKSGS